MKKNIIIHWFRYDLRLSDNPALKAAIDKGTVLPIYIKDTHNADDYAMGSASKWWLHHGLKSLEQSLEGNLSFYSGDPMAILKKIAEHFSVQAIHWNRCYEPWMIKRDTKIKEYFKEHGVDVHSYNASLLWEPWTIKKDNGEPYKVFTPFYKKGCLGSATPRPAIQKIHTAAYVKDNVSSCTLENLQLLPGIDWDKMLEPHWDISEQGAQKCFIDFLDKGLEGYKEGRNFPAKENVSRLSPYLHFGHISPNQIWDELSTLESTIHTDHFRSELAWREFSYSQLYINPDLPKVNLQKKFDNFPWRDSAELLKKWQQGITGIPMVDAGMRELWQTGYMHNRVRMIVGSFLVKNLRLHWRHGERWFWDTLVDADLANNSASWQWIAGCGADAAPYFRIFNPVTQGQKFDPEGEYIRKYIPELCDLPNKYLFNPWEAPDNILKLARVQLGSTYPNPIVDLKQSRVDALSAFQSLKAGL